MIDGDKKEFFIGADACAKLGVLKGNYPIGHGVVNNWDEMEEIWRYVFNNELKVYPSEHCVFLINSLINPKTSSEKMAQIMLETFLVPRLYITNSAVLSLYSEGKLPGFVVDSGESITQFEPIFDSNSLSHAIIKFDLAGRDLNEYMIRLLNEVPIWLSTSMEKKWAQYIKEKACYVALDFEKELKNVKSFEYELPDCRRVVIKDQRIRCPEALFKPSMLGKEGNGFGEICNESIQKCNKDIRKDLYNNIVLSGGTTLFNGFPERFTKEVKAFAPKSMKGEVKVIASPKRHLAPWVGGSILSSISSFKSMWITKAEYEEYGASIFHKKNSL